MWNSLPNPMVPFFGGILCHIFIFIRGEWHLRAHYILGACVVYAIGASILRQAFSAVSLSQALSRTSIDFLAYCLGLFASIFVYRAWLHPLQSFPGPPLAAVTKFWHVWQCRTARNHLVLHSLQAKYGAFARTGPNELTVFDPRALAAISQDRSRPFSKPEFYDFLHPLKGLNGLREPKEHDERRRVWDHGFNSKALQGYQARIHAYGLQLKQQIEARAGIPMDMRDWFYFLTFDLMGDLTFGKGFDMLQSGDWHSGPQLIRNAIRVAAFSTPAPWLAHLAFRFPFLSVVRDWNTMSAYCQSQMAKRVSSKSGRPDITQALVDASAKKGTLMQDHKYLLGDSVTLIVAGSDTVAPTLVHLFYRLCRHPAIAMSLKKEIRALSDIDDTKLRDLPYLDGCIKETLRLHPAVPTGGLRQVAPAGVTIGNRYIPGGTVICTPQYSLHRCRFDCIGKQLGYSELRHTIAVILQSFEFSAAHPEDLSRVEDEMTDTFTSYPGPLELIFRPVKEE